MLVKRTTLLQNYDGPFISFVRTSYCFALWIEILNLENMYYCYSDINVIVCFRKKTLSSDSIRYLPVALFLLLATIYTYPLCNEPVNFENCYKCEGCFISVSLIVWSTMLHPREWRKLIGCSMMCALEEAAINQQECCVPWTVSKSMESWNKLQQN